jgi:TetR/AcrR family transcriptional repressor of mexJK operon
MDTALQSGKHNTRQLILAAAQKKFAHFGFTKTTMDEIAGDVGFGKASLYYYFPTKESLFEAVVTGEQEKFSERIAAVLTRDDSACDKVRCYVAHRFEYFSKLMNLNILDLRSTSKPRPSFKNMFDSFASRELKFLTQILLEGKRSGELAIDSAERVAECFMHTMRGLRLCRTTTTSGPRVEDSDIRDLEKEVKFVTDIFLRGICKK